MSTLGYFALGCLAVGGIMFLVVRIFAQRQARLAQAMLQNEDGSAKLRSISHDKLTSTLVENPEVIERLAGQDHLSDEEKEALHQLTEMTVDERRALVEDAQEGDDPIDGQLGTPPDETPSDDSAA